MHVPIQIGTLHIDMVLELATEDEMTKLSRKWDRAKMATALHMKSMAVNNNNNNNNLFDLSLHSSRVAVRILG